MRAFPTPLFFLPFWLLATFAPSKGHTGLAWRLLPASETTLRTTSEHDCFSIICWVVLLSVQKLYCIIKVELFQWQRWWEWVVLLLAAQPVQRHDLLLQQYTSLHTSIERTFRPKSRKSLSKLIYTQNAHCPCLCSLLSLLALLLVSMLRFLMFISSSFTSVL